MDKILKYPWVCDWSIKIIQNYEDRCGSVLKSALVVTIDTEIILNDFDNILDFVSMLYLTIQNVLNLSGTSESEMSGLPVIAFYMVFPPLYTILRKLKFALRRHTTGSDLEFLSLLFLWNSNWLFSLRLGVVGCLKRLSWKHLHTISSN